MRLTVDSSSTLLAGLVLAGSVFFASPARAQVTSELGGGLGGMTYRGEVAPRYRILSNRPAGTVFYKRDVTSALVLRASLTLGTIRALDTQVKQGGNVVPVAASRQATFRAFLTELLVGAEYNFLDYYDFKRHTRWTPYFFTGVVGYYASTQTQYRVSGTPAAPGMRDVSDTKISIAVPVGLGIKYALSRELNLLVEAGGRRTFGDTFDNLADADAPQLADPGGPDWYFYNGISISYTFYKIICPVGQPAPRRF